MFQKLLINLSDLISFVEFKNPFNTASIQGNPKDIRNWQPAHEGPISQKIFFKKHLRPLPWRRIRKNHKNKE